MRSVGYVTKATPDSTHVTLGKHAQCVGCGACIAAADDRERRIDVVNDVGAKEGQKVEIEFSSGRLVGAAFLIFVVPLVVALAGGYAGYHLAGRLGLPPTLLGVGTGCLAFAGSLGLLRWADKGGRRSGLPRIVRILDQDESEGRC
jgi:sigma-E factor negative regulatory protein RseC